MKIGVFDSGVGGLSVAQAIERALPNDEIIFLNDSEHVPYGSRQPDEILGFVQPILEHLVEQGCKVIVIACNTVSTTILNTLRMSMSVPLIAIEPMVKPAAALTKTGVIAVCATPTTLASPRYEWLKQTYASGVTVIEPDCSDWSAMIEADKINQTSIATRLIAAFEAGADVIVLGCTHYHWIEAEINQISRGRATVIQPEAAIIKQLKRVMETLQV